MDNRFPEAVIPEAMAKELFVLTFDDFPKKSYFMAKDHILAADEGMQMVLDKLKSFWVGPRLAVMGKVCTDRSPSL